MLPCPRLLARFPYSSGVLSFALMMLAIGCSSPSATPSANTTISESTTPEIEESATAIAQQSVDIEANNADVMAASIDAQVIFLGETHTSVGDLAAQLEIIETLSAQSEIAIGLEMFQRPFQPVLDSYLAGDITEAELVEQSEYETRWGYDWEFYAPIVRYAKDNQIPLIALNTPSEVTRQVATDGLDSLSGEALRYIPPVDEIDTTDQAYRDAISGVFNAHGGAGHSLNFENFFAAQVLWDETMAERIFTQLEAEPERQMVALVGEGHIAYDYGIPNRVERRIPDVEHVSVRLIPAEQPIDPDFADFSLFTE